MTLCDCKKVLVSRCNHLVRKSTQSFECDEKSFKSEKSSGKRQDRAEWRAEGPHKNLLYFSGEILAQVRQRYPKTPQGILGILEAVVAMIPVEMIRSAVNNLTERVKLGTAKKGGHFELNKCW